MSKLLGIEIDLDDQQAMRIAKQVAYESDNLAGVCDIARNAIYKLREVDPDRLARMLKREFGVTLTWPEAKADLDQRPSGLRRKRKSVAREVTEEDGEHAPRSGGLSGWTLRGNQAAMSDTTD